MASYLPSACLILIAFCTRPLVAAEGQPAEPIGWLLLEGAPLTPELSSVLLSAREPSGTGITLCFNPHSRTIEIEGFVPGSPAAESDLSVGLVVQQIDDIVTHDKSLLRCRCMMCGKAGSKVKLNVAKPNGTESKIVEVMRKGS